MADEIEEVEEDPATDDGDMVSAYFGQIDISEIRRYVSMDMALRLGSLPDKAVKLAESIDRFLQGKSLRDVKDQ